MPLLRDEDLAALVRGHNQIIIGVPEQDEAALYARESPIQPSSIDLHIGDIYIPRRKKLFTRLSGKARVTLLQRYSLKPGYTAIVTTKEELRLPNDIAGIGFPPSGVSFAGLLMTNPGHIDPGYAGVLRFAVINMGSEDYILVRDDRIVTLLLHKLVKPVHAGWRARNNDQVAPLPTQQKIDRLSHDFVDVEARAGRVARGTVRWATVWATVAATVMTVLFTAIQPWFVASFLSPNWADELRKRVDAVAASVDIKDQQAKLANVQRELQEMKDATCRQFPRLSYCASARK